MSDEARESEPFSRWISRPKSLIALSALLLSLCGLFVAVYEASLVRRQQRVSVWPHLEVSASMTGEAVQIIVENAGVGPARVRAAVLTHGGEVRQGWEDLIRSAGLDTGQVDYYYSLIQNRVMPRDSDPEVIFRVERQYGPAAPDLLAWLRREIAAGELEVTLCYCSVYDEWWTASVQDVVRRSRGRDRGRRAARRGLRGGASKRHLTCVSKTPCARA